MYYKATKEEIHMNSHFLSYHLYYRRVIFSVKPVCQSVRGGGGPHVVTAHDALVRHGPPPHGDTPSPPTTWHSSPCHMYLFKFVHLRLPHFMDVYKLFHLGSIDKQAVSL